MPNDIASRQWRLDTARPYGSLGSVIWDSNIYVRNIEFSGYAAQADQCVLKDRNGRIVWSGTGSTTLAPIRLGDIGWINGVVLDRLDSGLCVLYVR